MLKDQLTICIPTFNRWAQLEQSLDRILVNNSYGVKVLIIDNASDVAGFDQVLKVIERHNDKPCEVVRNPVNIGGDANILRCIELCQTPYVLVIGDDDFVVPNFLDVINHYLEQDVNWGWVHFQLNRNGEPTKRADVEFSSPMEMVAYKNEWAELIFISATIFCRDLVWKGFWLAQRYQFSRSSHLVGLLKGWELMTLTVREEKQYKFLYVGQTILESVGHARDHGSFEQMGIFPGLASLRYLFNDVNYKLVRSAVRNATLKSFKPRVLGKELVHYSHTCGFKRAWTSMQAILLDLRYSLGWRYFIYVWYLPVLLVLATILIWMKMIFARIGMK